MTLDIAKLKAAAEKATPGPWQQEHRKTYDSIHNEEWYNTQVFTADGETVATLHWYPKDEGDGGLGTYRADNAEFIAAANPAAVLELIAALEAMAAAHMNLKLLADVYRQAYEEARARTAELEARTVTVELPCGYAGPYGSLVYDADAVEAAMELAGINLETGGE
ncbi:ead/Ea22-like family protein [Cronobacter sakazakii]|uniref:ead/Ea22-like family protein n=1 Tax=Cronobacter sakazakii TaxID=28141 RepID=UPI001F5120D9|nr:ead/Ea22-like family protein [Cronobacter sakazakii]MDI7608790.1 ead/Ea22-like family protein [Cronobacter sakazakii]MDI7614357.1 ead/Ea22-like family protein [Cronobacter sakazakii]